MNAPWKAILAFIGVFIAGSVFGGFFALRIGQQVAQRERPRSFVAQPPQPQFGTPLSTQLLRRHVERLELTPAQREMLRPIVARAEEQIGRIRQTSLEQTETIVRRMQQDIRAELTPDQRRKLDRMQKAQSEAMKKAREKRQMSQQPGMGPGQGPPPQNTGPNQPYPPRGPQNPPPQNYAPQPVPPPPDFVSPPTPAPPAGSPPPPRGL